MAELTKIVETGAVTITADKQMQVREDTVVYEGLIELSRSYFRYIVNPGDDVSNKPQIIQDLATLLWTPEAIEKWNIKVEEIRQKSGLATPQ